MALVVDSQPLSERMSELLLTVIEQYIDTARPVPSGAAAERSSLDVSPATVRATLAELAELDLLSQPHASAGRVPTEQAFRLYVDHLLRNAAALQSVDSHLDDPGSDLEDLLRKATFALSRATGQLAFYVGAAAEQIVLERIRFVRVSSDSVMAVLVSTTGLVQTRAFRESASDRALLDAASAHLSELVHGLTLQQSRQRLESAVEAERERSTELWGRVFDLGRAGLSGAGATSYVGEQQALLAQPEFADVDRLRRVLAALAEKESMLRLLERTLEADVVSVRLGDELRPLGFDDCAVVTAAFGREPFAGGLGVIGPVRMPYARVIPAVRDVRNQVGSYLG